VCVYVYVCHLKDTNLLNLNFSSFLKYHFARTDPRRGAHRAESNISRNLFHFFKYKIHAQSKAPLLPPTQALLRESYVSIFRTFDM
jgi:hypothetical protein